MVEIDKKIKETIKEIIFLLMMIILSYLIWETFKIKESQQAAITYYQKQENLKIIKSQRSEDEENKTFIKVENNDIKAKNYNVYLTIDKKDEQKIKNSLITISENSIDINALENETTNKNVYYKILTNKINSREENSYFISLNVPIGYELMIEENEEK
ncbi:MAG: hypothetical protein HFE04_02790 [Bacilli bacterium]|nr:hypothetical protein [Bacilli bacterium]